MKILYILYKTNLSVIFRKLNKTEQSFNLFLEKIRKKNMYLLIVTELGFTFEGMHVKQKVLIISTNPIVIPVQLFFPMCCMLDMKS